MARLLESIFILVLLTGIFVFGNQREEDYEVMGKKFWNCYLKEVKERVLIGEERLRIVEECNKE